MGGGPHPPLRADARLCGAAQARHRLARPEGRRRARHRITDTRGLHGRTRARRHCGESRRRAFSRAPDLRLLFEPPCQYGRGAHHQPPVARKRYRVPRRGRHHPDCIPRDRSRDRACGRAAHRERAQAHDACGRRRAHAPWTDRRTCGVSPARHGRHLDRAHRRPAAGCGGVSQGLPFVETRVRSMAKPLTIDVVSDVVCPWCFIGKKRLEDALQLRPDIPVEVRWHPYFLNDWVPREGISRDEYLTTKFGSPERYKSIAGRVAQAAKAEGLDYQMDKIARQPNTLDCHRLILWARNVGADAKMKQRLMELYFTEGADLTDREELVKAAADCGLDPGLTRELLASDRDVDRVTQEAEQAKRSGIDGVPCFIFGGVLAVSGAQDPAYLAEAMARAVDEVEKRGNTATAAE